MAGGNKLRAQSLSIDYFSGHKKYATLSGESGEPLIQCFHSLTPPCSARSSLLTQLICQIKSDIKCQRQSQTICHANPCQLLLLVCSISIWYLFARNSIPDWHCVSIRRQFDSRVVNFSLNFSARPCRVLSINDGISPKRARPIAHEPVNPTPQQVRRTTLKLGRGGSRSLQVHSAVSVLTSKIYVWSAKWPTGLETIS